MNCYLLLFFLPPNQLNLMNILLNYCEHPHGRTLPSGSAGNFMLPERASHIAGCSQHHEPGTAPSASWQKHHSHRMWYEDSHIPGVTTQLSTEVNPATKCVVLRKQEPSNLQQSYK